MKHNEPSNVVHKYKTNTRKEKVKPLLEAAISACAKHGGAAEIGKGYVIVDTNKYAIVLKSPTA